MKSSLIKTLTKDFEHNAHLTQDGVECLVLK